MADKHQFELVLIFGDLDLRLTVSRNTPLDRLKEIAAEKCGLSQLQPFILESFDSDIEKWAVVGEDYQLPVRGKLRIVLQQKVCDQLQMGRTLNVTHGGMQLVLKPL